MKKNKLNKAIYFVIGACFIVVTLLNRNYLFLPIGCCFIILGLVDDRKDKGKKNE